MEINTYQDFKEALSMGKYADGGYPVYYVCQDGGVLSFSAAWENRKLIREAIQQDNDPQWRVIGLDINWEDPSLYCDHTNKLIESAYAS